jgi:hypothetical protein
MWYQFVLIIPLIVSHRYLSRQLVALPHQCHQQTCFCKDESGSDRIRYYLYHIHIHIFLLDVEWSGYYTDAYGCGFVRCRIGCGIGLVSERTQIK